MRHAGREAAAVASRGTIAVLDVSPKVAEHLNMKKSGTAEVVVKPITVPQPDGGVKLGAGAAETPPWDEQGQR